MSGRLAVVVGDVINDIVVRPLAPPAYATDTPSLVEQSAGGSGANQAAWMAAGGARVRFAARAGEADADAHRAALERHGVEACITGDPDRVTGTIVVIVEPTGERSMYTDRGASAVLDAGDLPDSLLEGASLLHLSGYSLFSAASRQAVLGLRDEAIRRGVDVTVDPSSVAGLRAVGSGEFLRWTSGARVAFPNLDEGRLLTGAGAPEEVAALLLRDFEVVALTLGAGGALVASRSAPAIHLDAVGAAVVDSTGAGDAWCGGFLAAMLAGGDLRECGEAGRTAAALAVGRAGGRPA